MTVYEHPGVLSFIQYRNVRGAMHQAELPLGETSKSDPTEVFT